MKKGFIAFSIALSFIATIVYGADLTSTHFIIRDPSIGTGGGYGSSASYTMYSAGNLNVSGDAGSSSSFKTRDGFLEYPSVSDPVLSGNTVGSDVDLSWIASSGYNGYTVSGYNVGISTGAGGPYTFTSIGNVTTYSYTNLAPGTYYFVVQALDAFSNVIATSNEVTETIQTSVTFSLSANSISFGQLSSSGPRYATTTGGSNTVTAAHSISAASNSSSGYTVYYDGGTLASGINTITPATISGSATGTAGVNQFAVSLLASGSATVPTTYDQTSQNWDFASNTLAAIASTSGPSTLSTLDAYYIANASTLAPAGEYDTTLTYEITVNY